MNFSGLEKDSGFQMTLPLARRALRECGFNEVCDAQDITTLAQNVGYNFTNGMTEQGLLGHIPIYWEKRKGVFGEFRKGNMTGCRGWQAFL